MSRGGRRVATIAGLPFEKPEEYLDRSPFHHLDELEPPILGHVATNDSPEQRDRWNRTWTFFDGYLRPYEAPSRGRTTP